MVVLDEMENCQTGTADTDVPGAGGDEKTGMPEVRFLFDG